MAHCLLFQCIDKATLMSNVQRLMLGGASAWLGICRLRVVSLSAQG